MKKKTTTIPIDLVSIEGEGFHLMINIKIGRKKARLLIDTGASKTVFDSTKLKQILGPKDTEFEASEHLSTGLGTSNMESHSTTLKKIKIGDLILQNQEVVVLDLSNVNESYNMIGIKTIDGVLGSDLLQKYRAVIYFHSKKLKLYY